MIRRALDEDIGAGDITTEALFPKPKTIQAVIIAGGEGVLCGTTIAMAAFVMRNSKIKFMPLAMDGERIRPEQQIAYIEGDAKAILSAERTAPPADHRVFLARLVIFAAKQSGIFVGFEITEPDHYIIGPKSGADLANAFG